MALRILAIGFAITLVATHLSPASSSEGSAIPRPISSAFLASMTLGPAGPEYQFADPAFQEIVSLGLPAIPELTALLDDATPTSLAVPNAGGVYTVSDIAREAIGTIVPEVPFLDWAYEADASLSRTVGFIAFWEFVRGGAARRAFIRFQVAHWYVENHTQLTWVAMPEWPGGGYYSVSGSDAEE